MIIFNTKYLQKPPLFLKRENCAYNIENQLLTRLHAIEIKNPTVFRTKSGRVLCVYKLNVLRSESRGKVYFGSALAKK